MKKSLNIALLALVGLAMTGCDDFLDDNRFPKTQIINTPEYWSNANNVQLQVDRFTDELSAAYGTGGSGGWFYFKYLSDDQVGSSFQDWTFPTLPATNGSWDYSVIRGVNYIIEGVESSSLTPSQKANFLGIARLVRGYKYYTLVRMFGDVVWIDKVVDVNDTDILYGPRTNRDAVMDKVFEDIEFAVNNIEANSSKTDWSKDYARAILSEVALYEGTFCKYRTEKENGYGPDGARSKKYLELAASVSDELLGKYSFTDDYQSIYNSLWNQTNSTVVTGAVIKGLSANPELIYGRRYDEVNGRHSTISYTASSTTTSGMSLDAFNAFLFKDGKPKSKTSLSTSVEGVPTTVDGHPALSIQNLLDVRDARLSIITDPYVYYKGMEWSRAGCSGMNSSSGFGIAKYDNVLLPVTDRTNSAGNYTSCPIYWTSYIALNYAEAKAELGQFGQTEFNKSLAHLYKRAGLNITSVSDLESMNDTDNNMGVSSLLWEIRRCRRCELMFDNWIRYWDLVRWHQLELLDSKAHPDILRGAYVANAPVKPSTVDAEGYLRPYPDADRIFEYKHYQYPIPTGQIDLNDQLSQNPGW